MILLNNSEPKMTVVYFVIAQKTLGPSQCLEGPEGSTFFFFIKNLFYLFTLGENLCWTLFPKAGKTSISVKVSLTL